MQHSLCPNGGGRRSSPLYSGDLELCSVTAISKPIVTLKNAQLQPKSVKVDVKPGNVFGPFLRRL